MRPLAHPDLLRHQNGMMVPVEWIRTGLAIVLLGALAFTLVVAMRAERPWWQPWALVRATLQLAVLALILNTVIEHRWLVAAFLLVMVLTAAMVVQRRLSWPIRRVPTAAAVIGFSALVPGSVVVLSGAIAPEGRYLLALGGIVIGGVMTVSTLFGRSLDERLVAQRGEVEGWLALGATPRRAAAGPVSAASGLALMPATDQTRVTGLVTLPGAFVGAVFAGLPVVEAAQFQLIVLAAILAGGAIAAALWGWLLGAPTAPALPSSAGRD